MVLALSFVPVVNAQTAVQNGDVDPDGNVACLDLTTNLRYRDTDAKTGGAVSQLQDFLVSEGYITGNPTGYFGLATFGAVKKFQSQYGFSPTGFVGVLTRGKIKEITCNGDVTIDKNVIGRTFLLTIDPVNIKIGQNTLLTVKIKNAPANSEVVLYSNNPNQTNFASKASSLGRTNDLGEFTISNYENYTNTETGTFVYWVVVGGLRSNNVSINVYSDGDIPFNYDFTASPNTGSAPLLVNFSAYVQQGAQYAVHFGDGSGTETMSSKCTASVPSSCSNRAEAYHRYDRAGTYTATLFNNAGCPIGMNCPAYTKPLAKVTITVGSVGGNRPPVINGVTAPTTLKVGETGTWTINASDPENGSLSYAVNWMDTVSTTQGINSSFFVPAFVQTATFTHSYAIAGTYTVNFSVKDNAGQTVNTSATVQVGNATLSSITVLSPKGGEVLTIGTPVRIDWGAFGNSDNSAIYDITGFTDNGKDNIAGGITQVQAGCLGYGKGVCSYMWTPTWASSKIQIAITQRGTSNVGYSGSFSVISSGFQPSITSITPSSGSVGTFVKVRGNNLANTSSNGSSNHVWLNGYSFGATTFEADGTSLIFAVPTTLAPGTYQLAVKTSLSLPGSNIVSFIITAPTLTKYTDSQIITYLEQAARNRTRSAFNPATETDFDVNNDRLVNATDQILIRTVLTTSDTAFNLIYTRISKILDSQIGKSKTDSTFIDELDVDRNGVITSFDKADILLAIKGSRVYPPQSAQPSITVLSPNGGENFEKGKTYPIRWSSLYVSAVAIRVVDTLSYAEYRFEEDGLSENVATEVGTYSWTVPQTIPVGRNYKVVITDRTNSSIADMSNSIFSITAPITSAQPSISASPSSGTLTGASPTLWVDFVVSNYSPVGNEIVDFGDGSRSALGYTTSLNSRHDYNSSGTYSVKLLSGNSTTLAMTQVTVLPPPVVSNSAPRIITETALPSGIRVGESVNFSWTATDANNDDLTWSISWGDVAESGTCVPGTSGKGTQKTASHSWSASGTYTVQVSVSDCKGGTDSRTFTVNVGTSVAPSLPPTVSSPTGPTTVVAGTSNNWGFTATKADDYVTSYEINWGDNTAITTPVQAFVTTTLTTSKSHTYTTPGTYTITLTAIDSNGDRASNTLTVSVTGAVTSSNNQNMTANMFDALRNINPGLYR